MHPERAVIEAVAGVGPATVLNALGVALGFGILMLSQVPANARLGVLGVVNCLVATLLVLPALLSKWSGEKARTG